MKKYLFIIAAAALFAACASDDGNYDYHEVNDLTISGMESSYEVEQFTNLTIKPQISGTLSYNESDYDFAWYVYQFNSTMVPDTLSHEKDLNVDISLTPSSNYALVLQIDDKVTGRRTIQRADLTVVNSYSKGLAILSDVDGMAQVSFINSIGHITEDAYQAVNGRPVGRGPLGIYLLGRGGNTGQYIAIATEDSTVCCDNIDFSYAKNFQDMFYFPSSPGRLQAVLEAAYPFTEVVIVDGGVYQRSIYSFDGEMYLNYGTKVKGSGSLAPFDFYKDNTQPFFYDTERKCFVYDYYGSSIEDLSSGYGNEYWDATDVGMDMIWGGCVNDNDDQAHVYGIMQDTDGKRYIIYGIKGWSYDLETYASWYYITPQGKREISGDFASASIFAVSSLDPNYIYYASGSTIKCVSVITGNAISEYSLDANIDCMMFDPSDNTKLYVGTSNGSRSANSGSVYVLQMASDGQLTEQDSYKNICGKVVSFTTNTSDEE